MNDVNIKDIVIDGVQYYSAYFSCPVCAERGEMRPPTFWVHSSCHNDHLYIGSDATLYCSGCRNIMKIMESKYSCPYHSSDAEEYVGIGDPMAVAEAMCFALSLARRAGKEWITALVKSL